MFRTRLLIVVGIIAALVAFMLPALPASAQEGPYFDFIAVLNGTCTPGEYPSFHFIFGVPGEAAVPTGGMTVAQVEGPGIYHIWTLFNDTKGTFTGPEAEGPIFPGPSQEYFGDHGDINPIPAGTEPGDVLRQRVEVVWYGEGSEVLDVAEITWTCGSVAGCDTALPITSTAVVGAFTQTTPLYWTPGSLTSPLITIEAGKTAWVLGQDSAHQYYKIIWACSLLWAPVDALGPNPDAVWNGKPLPTGVVK